MQNQRTRTRKKRRKKAAQWHTQVCFCNFLHLHQYHGGNLLCKELLDFTFPCHFDLRLPSRPIDHTKWPSARTITASAKNTATTIAAATTKRKKEDHTEQNIFWHSHSQRTLQNPNEHLFDFPLDFCKVECQKNLRGVIIEIEKLRFISAISLSR